MLPGGALEVTEIVVYRFEDGTFDHVFREIPARRTDGIEIRYAEMDGRRLQFGRGTGEVEVRRGSPTRVRWRFAPRSGTTHTFTLQYVAHGAVHRSGGGDLLEWVALPTQHVYRIDASEIVVESPVRPAAPPAIDSRRVTDASVEPAGERTQVLARGIGANGWVKLRMTFPEGAVVAALPGWQQRQLAIQALASRWLIAAGVIVAVGLLLMFAIWQRYDGPPRSAHASSFAADAPPDTLRPALAGALASNGSVTLPQAMASLFTLADRGAITIVEEPKRWGQRHYTLQRAPRGPQAPAPEEQALIDIAFQKKKVVVESVTLAHARNRLAGRLGGFRKAVKQEMRGLGLLDDQRINVRSRYLGVSIALFILAAMLFVPCVIFVRQFGGWPLLIPGALVLVGTIGLIFYGALTPLSNEGAHRAERWRAYQRHLKDVARDRAQLREAPTRVLGFAVALGLASAWSKFMKHHPQFVPPWFHALSADGGGFPAFIADGGSAAAASGAAAGGAAGGGAAGAG